MLKLAALEELVERTCKAWYSCTDVYNLVAPRLSYAARRSTKYQLFQAEENGRFIN